MSTPTTPNTFYRFRSMEYLLGDEYQELENQDIYFASPDELNDPMEGLRDIVWRGDRIVWTNLLKNYIYCLHAAYWKLLLTKDNEEFDVGTIPIMERWDSPLSPQMQRWLDDIWQRFLNFPKVPEIIEALSDANHKIRYRELEHYLRVIQFVFYAQTLETAYEYKPISGFTKQQLTEVLSGAQEMLAQMLDFILLIEKAETEGSVRVGFLKNEVPFNSGRIVEQLSSLMPKKRLGMPFDFQTYNFAEIYLNGLEELLWAKWYTVCFMTNYHNSSVWGNYGGKHSGVCLIFETINTGTANNLELHEATSNDVKSIRFSEISYTDKSDEVDFFQSIGRLPIEALMKRWYTDDEGNISECGAHVPLDDDMDNDSLDVWYDGYLDSFCRHITTKTKDWAYKQEYRLILGKEIRTQTVHGKKSRTLTYDFNSLKGIIFGIKTSDEDKLRIIEIIQRKCEDNSRESFTFFQAYYSPADGGICKDEMQMRLVSHVGTVASDRLEN